ncbi:dihydrofolate reductase family protein [Streptomyces sp. NPDC048192]|jgi:dihydrofolate reductase|uniref:dihydrofolate reductase family protein n=1 Tax=unclassified Streptomyces TaxID=2593676 RepID=UPI00371F58A3
MRKLTYYVAASLDGYIAAPDGSYDFLPFEGEVREAILAEYPETMPVHVRGPLGLTGTPSRHFDTVIMGRGTYEPALKAGVTSPYAHLKQYVVSRTLRAPGPEVEIVADDPAARVRELKEQDGMGIWLAGGGKLAAALRAEIDELIIKHNPVVIGSGIPLFDGPFAPTGFLPTARRDFGSGVSIVTYTRK